MMYLHVGNTTILWVRLDNDSGQHEYPSNTVTMAQGQE